MAPRSSSDVEGVAGGSAAPDLAGHAPPPLHGYGDAGDARAQFAAFCSAQHPRLVGLLVLYCGDRELAHDLAQETLARLWRDRRKWDRIGSLANYAARTALNLAKNEFRRNAVRRRYQTLLDAEGPQLHHDADGAQSLLLRQAVAALAERKRRALILRYFADLSVAETAQVMDTPPNTVKSLTRRAIADLRSVLDVAELEGEDDEHSDA